MREAERGAFRGAISVFEILLGSWGGGFTCFSF